MSDSRGVDRADVFRVDTSDACGVELSDSCGVDSPNASRFDRPDACGVDSCDASRDMECWEPCGEKGDREPGSYPLPGASFGFSFHTPPHPAASSLMAPSSSPFTSVATRSTSRSRLSAWRRVDASWDASGPKTQSSLIRRLSARRSFSAVLWRG